MHPVHLLKGLKEGGFRAGGGGIPDTENIAQNRLNAKFTLHHLRIVDVNPPLNFFVETDSQPPIRLMKSIVSIIIHFQRVFENSLIKCSRFKYLFFYL